MVGCDDNSRLWLGKSTKGVGDTQIWFGRGVPTHSRSKAHFHVFQVFAMQTLDNFGNFAKTVDPFIKDIFVY